MKAQTSILLAALVCGFILAVPMASALDNQFTYQGRLTDGDFRRRGNIR
jgi:hypothetical protein